METPDNLPEEKKESTTYTTDTDFMREKIKQRPVNRRRLFRRTLLTVMMAVVFGVVACATFFLLEPFFNRVINPQTQPVPDPVVFPEEVIEDEVQPEDLYVDEIERQEGLEDDEDAGVLQITSFYQTLRGVATQASLSLVSVITSSHGTGWAGDPFETNDTTFGLIVADNGFQRLIVTDYAAVRDAETLTVSFTGELKAEAEILCRDDITGLCVLAVSHDTLSAENWERIPVATLGTSAPYTIIGTPVIAIGEPEGIPSSIVYGAVTQSTRTISLTDANYNLLSTDIFSFSGSNGVLVNANGEVVGIFTPTLSERLSVAADRGQITAYGISGIKRLIEKLSNNSPRAVLGVTGSDVPADVRARENIPQGAFILRVETDTAAMLSGIQAGDVITKIGDSEVINYTALSTALLAFSPGETVTVTLMRTGPDGYREIELHVTLGSASG